MWVTTTASSKKILIPIVHSHLDSSSPPWSSWWQLSLRSQAAKRFQTSSNVFTQIAHFHHLTTATAPTLPIPSPKHNISLNNCDINQFCPIPTTPPPHPIPPNTTYQTQHNQIRAHFNVALIPSTMITLRLSVFCNCARSFWKQHMSTLPFQTHNDVALLMVRNIAFRRRKKSCTDLFLRRLLWLQYGKCAEVLSAELASWRNCIPRAQKITTHNRLDHKRAGVRMLS